MTRNSQSPAGPRRNDPGEGTRRLRGRGWPRSRLRSRVSARPGGALRVRGRITSGWAAASASGSRGGWGQTFDGRALPRPERSGGHHPRPGRQLHLRLRRRRCRHVDRFARPPFLPATPDAVAPDSGAPGTVRAFGPSGRRRLPTDPTLPGTPLEPAVVKPAPRLRRNRKSRTTGANGRWRTRTAYGTRWFSGARRRPSR